MPDGERSEEERPDREAERLQPSELLALRLIEGAGHVRIRTILSVLQAWECPFAEAVRLPAPTLAAWFPSGSARLAGLLAACTAEIRMAAERMIAEAAERGIYPLSFQDSRYPAALSAALGNAAPVLLFAQGNPDLLSDDAAGIVGTRRPSEEGLCWAEACARVFAARDIPVISGGARGIDTAAHEAVLHAGGRTVVVLPQGLLTYPVPPRYAAAIEAGRALLLSEFHLGAPWRTHAAVTRNATISALSSLLCVIEPHSLNGSLLTARHCLDQGKPVFHAGLCPADHPLTRRRNARPLLAKTGRVDPGRILRVFGQARTPLPRQSELF